MWQKVPHIWHSFKAHQGMHLNDVYPPSTQCILLINPGRSWICSRSMLHLCKTGEGRHPYGASYQVLLQPSKNKIKKLLLSFARLFNLKTQYIYFWQVRPPAAQQVHMLGTRMRLLNSAQRHLAWSPGKKDNSQRRNVWSRQTLHTGRKRWCCGTCGKEHRLRSGLYLCEKTHLG